jgi:trypsin/PKD domain-containing protein
LKPHRKATTCAALAALLVAAPAAIGSANGDRIIGGSPASAGEYPAQGFLQINTDADPTDFEAECGGTLLGRLWFLTAAHCVTGSTPADLRIYMGDVDLTQPNTGTFFNVAVIDIHSGYDAASNRNDLAMLTLAAPAPFEPLRVVRPNESARWAGGTQATIIGWGTTQPGDPNSVSNVLLEANVPLISDEQCTGQYGTAFDPNTMVCAWDGSHDTCQGDSGGPLMVPNPAGGFILAGVTSWGFGCAHPFYAGVYARLGGADLNAWVLSRHPWTTFGVPPVLHAGSSATFNQISFHPIPGNAFTTFNWDLDGDGAYDDLQGPSAARTFSTAGNHAVGLEATNAAGDRVVSRQIVPVNGLPTAVAGGPYTIAEGGAAQLVGTGTDPEAQPLVFAWDLDRNGTFEASGPNQRFAPRLDGPTTTNAALQVCDAAGACVTDNAAVVVRNVAPRANAGPNRRTRRMRRLRFRVRISDPGPDRHRVTWNWGDGRRSTGRIAVHRWRRARTYVVRVTVRDDDGARTIDTVRVRVTRR